MDREQASTGEIEPVSDDPPDAPDTEDLLDFTVSPIEPEVMRYYELDRNAEGVVVTSVDPFSEAYDKGLREGILILEVNRTPVQSLAEFRQAISTLKPGELVNFYVQGPAVSRFVTLRFGAAN